MIYIYKNQSNTVALTLDEKATNTSHDWLFEFTSVSTGQTKLFHATDISSTTARYNKFIITESSTENVYNGTIELNPTGQWTYKVYEMPVSSPPSLNTALAYAIVEEGKVAVINTSESETIVFDEEEEKNNVTFEE